MRVLMLFTRRGSEDGFVVRQFFEGQRYEMADGLARYFIRQRWAVMCTGDEPVDTSALRMPVDSPFSFHFT